jgi:hypothetical protein
MIFRIQFYVFLKRIFQYFLPLHLKVPKVISSFQSFPLKLSFRPHVPSVILLTKVADFDDLFHFQWLYSPFWALAALQFLVPPSYLSQLSCKFNVFK